MAYIRTVDEETVKGLFEDLSILERAAYRDADPAAASAFSTIYDLVRRSVLSNDQHRVVLARVISRFDRYREPVPGDPDRSR